MALVAATLAFVLAHLAPGDPFAIDDPRLTAATRDALRARFGLDRPLAEQYLRWLGAAARGDFGWSFSRHQPVGRAIADALPATLLLMGTGLALAFAIGITLGAWQAARRGRPLARVADGVMLLLYATPDFWLALLALLAFAYWLPVFPAGGAVDPLLHDAMGPWGRLLDRLRHLALPALVVASLAGAMIARYQRAALLEVLSADYVLAARARGLGERRVVLRHALRNALGPVITLLGLALPALLGGALFVERVFDWPGVGQLALGAVASRDYPLITASVAVSGLLVAAGATVADLLARLVDPRLRDA